jgi:microcystin-dependent protein
MAFSTDDFNKVWASTSPLTPYEFSENNYKEGWNFVGGTPPARQMWDSIQKSNDEKSKFLYELAQKIVPVGVVQAYAGTTTPQGWLLCDGSAVSRTDYADLFAVIGTTYGSGDGTSTFNLPNLVDKFIEGSATAGTEKTAGLPNITGAINARGCLNTTLFGASNGALSSESIENVGDINAATTSASHPVQLKFNASNSDSIYGNSATVQPPALTMQYIIKY